MKNRIFNKRVLSFFLALVMVMGILPAGIFTASAAETISTDLAWRDGAYVIEVYNNATSVTKSQLYGLLSQKWETKSTSLFGIGVGGYKYNGTQIKGTTDLGNAGLTTGVTYTVERCTKTGYSLRNGETSTWVGAGSFTVEVYDILTINTTIDGVTTTKQVKVFRGQSYELNVADKSDYDVKVEGTVSGNAAGKYTVGGLVKDADVTITYSKPVDSQFVTGTIADGVTVKVNGNDLTNAGVYVQPNTSTNVVATYTGKDKNTYVSSVIVNNGSSAVVSGKNSVTLTTGDTALTYTVNVATAPAIVLSKQVINYNTAMSTTEAEAAIKALVATVAGDAYTGEITVKYYGLFSYVALSESSDGALGLGAYRFGDAETEKVQITCGNYVWEGEISLTDTRDDSNIGVNSGDITAEYYTQMTSDMVEKNLFNAVYSVDKSLPDNLKWDDGAVTVEVYVDYYVGKSWIDVTGEIGGYRAMDLLGDSVKVRIVFAGNENYKGDTSDEVTVKLVDSRKDVTVEKTEVTVSYQSQDILADMIAQIGANYNGVSYKHGNSDVDANDLLDAAASSKGNTLTVKVTLAQGDEEYKPCSIEVVVSFVDAWYTVSWYDETGTVVLDTTDALIGTAPTHADASKESTTQYSYTFAGWIPVSGVENGVITGNASYKASFTNNLRSYMVTWKDNDGTTLYSAEVEYGQIPEYAGKSTTELAAEKYTAQYTYTFTCWTPEVSEVTGEVTYTATYSNKVNEYTIKFFNHDGTLLEKLTVKYGDVPSPTEPEGYFEGDVYNSFAGWNTTVVAVTGDAEYTATYTEKEVHTVTFNPNGATLEVTDTYRIVDGEKVAELEISYAGYRFLGWYLDEEKYDFTTPVTGDITITAKWVKLVTVSFDGAEIEDQTFDINGKATKPADPTQDQAIFGGWYLNGKAYDFATPVTEDITLTAKWIADTNSNGVADADETLKVTISGNGTVNGKSESFEIIYNSKTETTVHLNVVPNVVDGASKSYISSITVGGVAQNYTFVDYCVDIDVEVGKGDVVVAFTDCGFEYDEESDMRFYVGMETPKYETLYNAVIKNPIYNSEFVKSVKYLARPAATYQMQVPVLFEYTVPLINYKIKIGGDMVDIDLDDAWLDVGESFKTLTPEELQKQYDVEIQKIKDKIAAIDLSDISLSNAWDKVKQFATISEELTTLIQTISNEAQYLGYHQFGASGLVDENGNAQEMLQVIYDDGKMHLVDEEVYVTLVDDRIATEITGGNLTFEYDEFTDADIMNSIVLMDANGNVIDGELIKHVDLKGTQVGTRTYTVYYAGSWDYKPCEVTFTLEVIKAPSTVTIPNVNVTYGDDYNFAPVITNKHGNEIKIDAIEFILGLDVSEFDIDGDGIKGLEGRMQLILTDELQTILSMVGLEEGIELNINDLIKTLTNTGLLEQWGVTSEMVDTLKQVLDTINGVVEANNLMITIGGEYPTDVGAYLHGAVTVDANYETAFGIGYAIIKPNAERVWLDWNFTSSNTIFTWSQLNAKNLGASAFNDQAFATKNDAATAFIHNLFFGFDSNGEFVITLQSKGTDVELLENALGNGAYLQLAFIAEFGNELQYAVPIVRPVIIVPGIANVELVGATGTPNNEMMKDFNNQPQGFGVIVTDEFGNVIYSDHYQNIVALKENAQITVYYMGVQSNGKSYHSTEKPVHAGTYIAIAVYTEYATEDGQLTVMNIEDIINGIIDGIDFNNIDIDRILETLRSDLDGLECIGMDAGLLVIVPVESNVDVSDKIEIVDPNKQNRPVDQVTVGSSADANLKPDSTIISAGIASNGTFTENGWNAVNGNVNIDFPAWVDALLAEYVPGVANGITVAELSGKLTAKLPAILAALEEKGASNEILNSLTNAIDNVVKVLDEIPANTAITFENDIAYTNVGAYVIVAIVTDSDHIPSVDVGFLVIRPNVTNVELEWSYEDENGIFTRDLLDHVDLLANAYENGVFNAIATGKITYQFIGVNANGEFVIYNDPATLPNGAYIQVAYIAFELDGQMYISDMIARPVVITPSNCNVVVDELRTEFDNTAKAPNVTIIDLEGNTIDATNGQFTYIYAGMQTNGKPYMSNEAPVHAGVYEVIVTYVEYDENGAMRYYGVGVGGIMIDLAESNIDVTGGEVEYDGNGHTANVTIGSTAEGLKPDYILISGGAWITGNIDSVGINALHGNVNIDFPRWFDAVIADTEAFQDGVSPAYLIRFINSYRDDVMADVADALAKIGVTMNVDKMNAYIDELLAALAQMPADVTLTFIDNITYTNPGYYFYYGIVTDSDHYPSTDTGLVKIDKLDMDFDLENTTLPYNGNEQFVNSFNPLNTDFLAIITNDRYNTANILVDADMMYVIDLVERVLGREIPTNVNISDIYEKVDVATLIAALNEIIATVEQYELPAIAVEMVEWIKSQLATMPTTGTITVNGELPVNVDEYKIYAITYSNIYKSVVDGAILNITPADITSVDAKDTFYNATERTTELTVIGVNGEVLTEGVDFVIVSGNKATNAGTYTVTIKGIGNYTGTYTADWTINKATASVAVNDATKVYGDNDPIFSAVTNDLLGDDALVITFTREEGEIVGEYVITASASDDNYNINFTTGTLTITKATVTVDVIDASKTYGAADPEFQATVNGLKFNDKLNITFTREEGENVGEYVITATAADSNYDISFTDGKLTITTAEVIVTVNNATKVYGEKDPTFTATVTGMQNGESLNLTFTREEGENVGEYVITATAGDANYAIAFNAGKLTITPAKLTVTLDDKDIHVGNPIPEFTWTIDGLVNGDTVADITVNASTTDGANTKIGTYTITATAKNANYTITVVDATLTVADHTMVLVKEQAGANCQELGHAWYKCTGTGCDYEKNGETVPGTVHEKTHIEIVEANCVKTGTKKTVCNACGAIVAEETLPINNNHALYKCKCLLCEKYFHEYKAVVTDPTCTDKGYTTHTCSVCGDSYVDTYVDALGHKYEEKVTDPTCTDKGYTTHTCSVCGDSYVDTYKDAIGHTTGKVVVEKDVKPTCTDGGVLTKATYCANCHKLIERTTDVIDALGHKYEVKVTAPTCTDKGYTTHTCSVCGDSYVDTYVDALVHKAGEPTKENVVGPTTTNAGQYDLVVRCTVCNEKLSSKPVVLTAIAQNKTTGVYYPTLAEAIATVKNGETIVFLKDIDEDVTIKQVKNLAFTIDGANYKYNGTMTVSGTGYAGAQGQALTIKNIHFMVDGYGISANEKGNFARNITVDGCTFTGTNGTNYDYGMILHSVYNIVVMNTIGTNLYDLVYGRGSVNGLTAENVEVLNSANGIWLTYPAGTITFTNVTTATNGGTGVGFKNSASGTVTFNNCDIDRIDYSEEGTKALKMIFNDTVNNLVVNKAFGHNYLSIVLNNVDTTVTAMEGLNASTTVSGYKVVYEGGKYKLAGIDYVAQIGTTKYESIQAAVNAAQNGDTIVILASHAVTSDATALILVSGKNITIDLNGYTLNADIVDNGKDSIRFVFRTQNGASLTVKNGTVVANGDGVLYYMFSNYDTSSFTIESGNYTLSAVNGGAMFYSENSDMAVKGGTFTQVTNGWMFNTVGNGAGNVITVYGGTYNRYFIGGKDHNENPYGEVKLAEGLALKKIDENLWTVEKHVAGEAVREEHIAPTLDAPGCYDMVVYCKNCGAELSRVHNEIPKLNAVAKIGDTLYLKLQDAIDAVKDGETIVFLTNIDEDVTIKQVKNVKFTIDGANYKYFGTMTVNGTGYAGAQGQALTIKNIHFIVDGYGISANTKGNYARNITVDGCTFTGANGDNNDYGMIFHSVYNIVVENTIGTNLFDLVYGRGSVDGFTAENVQVTNSAHGIWLTYPTGKITFTNVTTATNGGTGVGFKNYASGTVTFNNCDIDRIVYSEEGTKSLEMIFNNTANILSVNEAFGHEYLSIVLNNVDTTVKATTDTSENAINDLKADSGVVGYNVVVENGIYKLVRIDYVAQIGDTKYVSIQAAVNEAKDGDVIVILKDHELTWDGETVIDGSMASMVVVAGKTVTIDLNGKKLTVDANKMNTDLYAVFAADNGGELTMNDSVGGGSVYATGIGFKSGVTAYCLMMAYEDGTSLTINSGNYYMEAAHDSLIYAGDNECVTVNDGYFTLGNVGHAPTTGNNGKPWIFNVLGANDRHLTVNGGTFNADIDSKDYQYWQYEVAIKDGYCAQPNGNDTWTIKAHVKVIIPGKEPTATTVGNKEGLKCSECGKILVEPTEILPKGTVAMIKENCYATLAEAIAMAMAGDTVVLVADTAESMVMIPAGVTLNLNGKYLTAGKLLNGEYLTPGNLLSFGNVIDNDGTTDGLGGIIISNDRTQAFTQLQPNNTYLPIYDAANGCYRFFGYKFIFKGAKAVGTAVKYGVAIRFSNVDAYTLLSNTTDSDLVLSFNLQVGNKNTSTYVLEYSVEGIKQWAEAAYKYYANAANTKDQAITMTVGGIPEGTLATMNVVLTSVTGVTKVAETEN